MNKEEKIDKGADCRSMDKQGTEELEALRKRLEKFEQALVRVSPGNYKGNEVLNLWIAGSKRPLMLGRRRAWAILQVVDDLRKFTEGYHPGPAQRG